VAKITQKCGKTSITYDSRCSYSCRCYPNEPCKWSVSCPDGQGGTIDTEGTGLTVKPPRVPVVTVAGELKVCARLLEKAWKRAVIVPASLQRKKIRRRKYSGTPEEIAGKLGLELGPRPGR